MKKLYNIIVIHHLQCYINLSQKPFHSSGDLAAITQVHIYVWMSVPERFCVQGLGKRLGAHICPGALGLVYDIVTSLPGLYDPQPVHWSVSIPGHHATYHSVC